MFFQSEVTTHCTFICLYGAGRDLPPPCSGCREFMRDADSNVTR